MPAVACGRVFQNAALSWVLTLRLCAPHFSTGGLAPYVAEVFSAVALKTSCYPSIEDLGRCLTACALATAASAGSRRLRAGIPVRFAHSNVVGTYGSPQTPPPWPVPLRFFGKCQGVAPRRDAARRGFGNSVPENGWAVSLKRLSFPFDPSLIYGDEADMIKAGHKFFSKGE